MNWYDTVTQYHISGSKNLMRYWYYKTKSMHAYNPKESSNDIVSLNVC